MKNLILLPALIACALFVSWVAVEAATAIQSLNGLN